MRILVLGGDGMLGHQLLRQWQSRHDVRVTLRLGPGAYQRFGLFNRENSYFDADARDGDRLLEILADHRPEAVVNAVGIVKQRAEAGESIPSILINSLLPHRLAAACALAGARLVHMSTDCVFSGARGMYCEDDAPDPGDLYGRSKLLGEVTDAHCVTLRTSIIGLELHRKTGLVEWFLAQENTVSGFANAIYTGFTTAEMARIVEKVLIEHPGLHGIHHVSSDRISKWGLLQLIGRHFGLATEIVRDDVFRCDRSLDSRRFRETTGYRPPSWEAMIAELAQEYRGRTA